MQDTSPKNTGSIFPTLVIALLTTFFTTSSYATCWFWEACDEYETNYPILLVHGVSGWDSILGIDYFYAIPGALEERGATVFQSNVTAWDSPTQRGEDLIPQVEAIIAITGASKVNIIAHSLGGPTARYVAAVRPELVASVTTVNGTNFGSHFADANAFI